MNVLGTVIDILGTAVLVYFAATVLTVAVLLVIAAVYRANTAVRKALERRYLGIEDDAFDGVPTHRSLEYTRTAYEHAVAEGRWWGYVLYGTNQVERFYRDHGMFHEVIDFFAPVLWPIELLGRRLSDRA
jgi:hypothetical protein